ncbi:MAG: hypothetical protein MMC23_004523 [Stictis urceolatum]|nr:hypothetical protein [Stictis urceolata]
MDFAPYQDTSPEVERTKSPPPRRSLSRSPIPRSSTPQRNIADSLSGSALPPPSHFGSSDVEAQGGGGPRSHADLFGTSLPMRMDHEAMLAYLALPPAGGVLLLVLEHRSDYVRFHAWQSSLLFTAIFILHLIFSFSAILSWMLFVVDIGLIAFLTMRAYRDADTLDRWEVPFFGRLASSFVDDE